MEDCNMNTLPLIEHIESLFKQNDAFSDKEGKLFVPKILESIDKVDEELVKLLMQDEKAKEQFFMRVEDVYVLKQNDLIEFFTMNEYFNHSFTSYTNKIGLIRKDNFIKKFDDVVLAFPYKDCVLEGGQTKDDEKNNEVFYNSILSRDEIDRLFEPKVLTNIKRFDKEGEHEVEEINEEDNLIIKGNNLLALHSLKKRYAGKVKLIYIDPPYNTGNDSFKYNDSFNHSTWLTFMKNRLEVARELLSDDGVIFVSINDIEAHYLKILTDEIFQKRNFIGELIRKTRSSTNHDEVGLNVQHEVTLIFAKNIEHAKLIGKKKTFKEYKNPDNDPNGEWISDNPSANLDKRTKINNFEIVNPYTKKVDLPPMGNHWRFSEKSLNEMLKSGKFLYKKEHKENERGFILKRYKKDIKSKYHLLNSLECVTNEYINQVGTRERNLLFGKDIFDYPKPELLLKTIIESSTNKNDLVLDFHLGSGTTCAVAHKMGRRYIGIEQMDYIEDIAVERIKKVIEGEQGGISKAVEWQGGGSFVYAELKEIDTFSDSPINKLNKNMQYLPISEIEDEEYAVTPKEIELNKKFYGVEDA